MILTFYLDPVQVHGIKLNSRLYSEFCKKSRTYMGAAMSRNDPSRDALLRDSKLVQIPERSHVAFEHFLLKPQKVCRISAHENGIKKSWIPGENFAGPFLALTIRNKGRR